MLTRDEEAILSAYFILSFFITILLGTTQKKADDIFAKMGISFLVAQGALTIICLYGTPFFPAGALWLAFTILIHHALIHSNELFEGETCSCAPFQCKDVLNHETWVVASAVAGFISFFHA